MIKKIVFLQILSITLVINAGSVYRHQMPENGEMYQEKTPVQSKTISSSIINTKITNITYYPVEENQHQQTEYTPEHVQEPSPAVQYEPEHEEMAAQYMPEHEEMAAQYEPEHEEMAAQYKPEHEEMAAQYKPEHEEMAVQYKPEHEEMAVQYEPSHEDMAVQYKPEHEEMAFQYEPSHEDMAVNLYVPTNADMYKKQSMDECDDSDHLSVVEYDCQKFKMCANGKIIMLTCPNDLVFDPELKICNFRRNVNGPCGIKNPVYF